jgi:hypothetical protein
LANIISVSLFLAHYFHFQYKPYLVKHTLYCICPRCKLMVDWAMRESKITNIWPPLFTVFSNQQAQLWESLKTV